MADRLWTYEALIAAAGGTADGAPAQAITGFSIDTRTLAPGEVFVALTDQRDGHAFVPAAFARGAAAALVRRDYARQAGDGALIRVDEPLAALGRIGVAARARLSASARVVAVTGSAGKSGTKEMLRACLRASASAPERVHAPEKSYNNHWGVPLTLARMPADTEFAVFEIGMNHADEIRPLTRMVRPHIAIVTNVLPVHVGNFADGEIGVANAKAEIFEGLEPGGTAIILADSPHAGRLRQAATACGATVSTFGRDPGADAVLVACDSLGEGADARSHVSVQMRDDAEGFGLDYDLGMPGTHIATNSLAVVLALLQLGRLRPAALKTLGALRPADGRGARQTLGAAGERLLLLDESYNANPASVAAALANLGRVERREHPRRIAVLGDMLELGDGSVGYHKGLAGAATHADLVLCCGPMMRHLYDLLSPEKQGGFAPTSAELAPLVVAALRPGDAVMVKGSLGTRMAPIVDAIKKRFAPPADGR